MKKVLLTLLFVASCFTAMAQWSENPAENNLITPPGMNFYSYEFKVTPEGTTYIVFDRPTDNGIITGIQILDKDGKKFFPEEGKIISKKLTRSWTVVNDLFMIDKDNNMIIAVHDSRNSSDDDVRKPTSYSIYKISPTGEMLWGEDGVDLNKGEAFNIQAAIRMIQLEDGSYAFAWMNSHNNDEGSMYIQMQRLSADGEFLWDNYIELKDNLTSYSYPYLTNAGNNQINLVYAKGSNQDIMVRKIDFDGSSVWPQDVRVYRGGFSNIPLWVILKVVPDPNGGVFVGWFDDRSFTNKESTFISYVKPNGTLGFASGEEGERVGYSDFRSFDPDMIYDSSENCLFVTWRETSPSQTLQRIMGQKIAMTGELKWGPEGIELYPLKDVSVGFYSVQKATPGQMTAFYMVQHAAGYGDVKAYAVRVDKDGAFVWKNEPLVLASCTSEKNSLQSSPLINDSYWLTMFEDERSSIVDSEGKSIGHKYMQKVNLDGTFGGPASIASTKAESFSFTAIPSVIEESTQFVINNKEAGMTDLSIYSVSGQKVAVVCHQEMNKGINEISWNAKSVELPSGVYMATLTTATSSQSIRIIVK